MEAKGPFIFMETCFVVFFVLFFVSNHNFACTKEHPRIDQLGFEVIFLEAVFISSNFQFWFSPTV